MNKAKYYKIMFLAAGIYDILAATIFAIFSPTVTGFLAMFGLAQDPELFFFLYCFIALVAVIGFQYILVSVDITKNHAIISTGMISKILFTIVLTIFLILRVVAWPSIILGVINLVFTALFIEFYVNYKKLNEQQIVQAYAPKVRD